MSMSILIVDDHGLIRAGLRALLEKETDFQVVGEAADGSSAIELTAKLAPDIILMDISMPGLNGMETTSQVKQVSPKSQVLAMSVHEDESMLREMIRSGASGYIIKRAPESELLRAIHQISQGNMYVHPSMTRALLKDVSPNTNEKSEQKVVLTGREKEVLYLLARGYTNRQIAQTLSISPRTVEGHRGNLVGKLGISSRMELLNYAEANGLLDEFKSGENGK